MKDLLCAAVGGRMKGWRKCGHVFDSFFFLCLGRGGVVSDRPETLALGGL